MESEPSSVAPSLGLNSKLDNTNVFQGYSYSQPSLAPFNNTNNSYQSTPYSSNLHFQSPNDLFDSSKTMPMNTQRGTNLENTSLQGLQSRLIESKQLANAPQDKISLTQSSSSGMSSSGPPVPVNGPSTPSQGHQSFAYDERFHALYEREIRWNEVLFMLSSFMHSRALCTL